MSPVQTRIVIGPNASLSERGAWLVMGIIALVTLGIGTICAFFGFWPVLPFAGLEVAALGAAFWITQKRNRYREILKFSPSLVSLEIGMAGQGMQTRVELPRAWSRVRLESGPRRNDPTRLWLCCSAQRVELGRCLTDEERAPLAARIRELLKANVDRSEAVLETEAASSAPAAAVTQMRTDERFGD